MRIVEEYAQRVAQKQVNEKNKKVIKNLDKKRFTIEEIAEIVEVSTDFVKKTLSH